MLKATLKKLNMKKKKLNMSGIGWACHCKDALMAISSIRHLWQTMCHKISAASPSIPYTLLTGWLWPKFSHQEEKSMFLLLEFERADDDRSDATGPLIISHKKWCHFLLVLFKMLSCCEEIQATHLERPHGETTYKCCVWRDSWVPNWQKANTKHVGDKISRWLQPLSQPPALGLQSWDLRCYRVEARHPRCAISKFFFFFFLL